MFIHCIIIKTYFPGDGFVFDHVRPFLSEKRRDEVLAAIKDSDTYNKCEIDAHAISYHIEDTEREIPK